jgi:DNA-directed RNA polymerase subunit RPC12/RpoP
MKCQYCSSKNIGKAGLFGKSKDKQRYRCKKCKRFSYALIIVEDKNKKQDIAIEPKASKKTITILEMIKEKIKNLWKIIK